MVEVTDAMVEALKAAKEVADVAAGLTSCRSDDEFVWAAQAKIDAALEAALASPAEVVEPVVRVDVSAEGWKLSSTAIDVTRHGEFARNPWRKMIYDDTMNAVAYVHGATAEEAEIRADRIMSALASPPQQEPARLREALADEQRAIGVGMAIAAGIIMRSWGDDTHAREILGAAGLDTLDKLRASGVDQYDIDLLTPVVVDVAALAEDGL